MPQPAVPLRIEPATADQLELLIDDPAAFSATYALDVIDGYIEFDDALAHTLALVRDEGVPPEWMTYLFIDTDDAGLVGVGGFTGAPTDGAVEIGYGIAPSYRGRGYATAAARALVAIAQDAGVETVRAHTLPEPNHSTRVLERIGFERVAVVEDPEDGTVWRWELSLHS